MSLRINGETPNFTSQTTHGEIDFYKWIGDGWGILFSHPKDFTPVCTTELGYMAKLEPDFSARNCKVIGLSDDVIIVPAVSGDEAKQKYPGGWKAPKPYLRIVAQPE